MNAFEYFVQVNGYLILFYGFFYLLLKNETFFNLNRTYLMGGAVVSFLIPILHSDWINGIFGSQPVAETKVFINALLVPMVIEEDAGRVWTLTDWIVILYLTIALLMFCRLLYRLCYILLRPVYEKSAAYSFFNRIFISESLASYPAVMKHEETHVQHCHSLDVILLELLAIVVWYNPVVYLYKRSIKHINEFIADEAACREERKEEYALLLLSNTLGVPVSQLVNNFYNQSLLKKRIMMLHKKKSNKSALLKYGLSVPLFTCMLVFSSAGIDAKSKEFIEKSDVAEPISTLKKIEAAGEAFDVEKVMTLPKIIAVEVDTAKDEKPVNDLSSIDKMPEFKEGLLAFYEFIGKNFKYPAEARKDSITGKVILSFIVEKDGALTDIKVLKNLGYGTGEAAVDVLKHSPNWNPGLKGGKPVRVQFTLPIALSLDGGKPAPAASPDRAMKLDNSSSGSQKVVGYLKDKSLSPLFIMDGEVVEQAEIAKLSPDKLAGMYVYKDATATALYGKKGEDGVIMVVTKGFTGKSSFFAEDFKGLVILNGKPQAIGFNLNSVNPTQTESVTVIEASEAVAKYGGDAREGAIIIKTK